MSVNDHRTSAVTEEFEVIPGPSPSSSTFIFGNEDHTLGNSLNYVLMQRTETEFCGYSVPHPYEPKMNIKLQANAPTTSLDVMKNALKDLEDACTILDSKFDAALKEFELKTSPVVK